VPPVPSLPTTQRDETTRGKTRPASLQLTNFKVASQQAKDGQGAWFGAAKVGDLSSIRKSDAVLNNPPLDPRPGSVSPSINFSYPRGIRVGSPQELGPVEQMSQTQQFNQSTSRSRHSGSRPLSMVSDQTMVFDPNTRRMVSKAQLLAREQPLLDVTDKPVKRKKKKNLPSKTGSHLARGTVARAAGTAVDVEPPRVEANKTERPKASTDVTEYVSQTGSRTAGALPTQRQEEPTLPEVDTPWHHDQRVASSDMPILLSQSEPKTARVIGKKPSTVREEPEFEAETSQIATPAHHYYEISGASHPKTRPAQPQIGQGKVAPSEESPVELPAEAAYTQELQAGQVDPLPLADPYQHGSVKGPRVHSSSPIRTAHFGSATDQLVVRHSPPPRSISPRKSALKHTSPSRGASPSDGSSETSAIGRINTDTSPEAVVPRKKSVRVSFDDENTVVVGHSSSPPTETDSPLLPSPQAKRPWYSNIGRNKKKDLVTLDEDEIMKPRPALPSFGSIREKKGRDVEERPLVRPQESAYSPPMPASPAMYPSITGPIDTVPDFLGHSSDSALGSLLSQEAIFRNEANTSKFREPLPPVVTSIEGSGYVSNSYTSSEDEDEPEIVTEPEPTMPSTQVKAEIEHRANGSAVIAEPSTSTTARQSISHHGPIPAISISHPSPEIPKQVNVRNATTAYFDIPGGFPKDESEASNGNSGTENDRLDSTRQDLFGGGKFQKQSTVLLTGPPETPRSMVGQRSTSQVPETDSDGSSIYSDAYEDLSEMEGDGFLSLNAVLTTPISSKESRKTFEEAALVPSIETTPTLAVLSDSLGSQTKPHEPEAVVEDDWEKAKIYWRSLTVEKRKQLEKEALQEAGEDADLEDVTQSKKKARKKKSVERARTPQLEHGPIVNPERVYQIRPGTQTVDPRLESHMLKENRESMTGANRHVASASEGGKLRKSLRGSQAVQQLPSDSTKRYSLRSADRPATSATSRAGIRGSVPTEQSRPMTADHTMRQSLRSGKYTSKFIEQQEPPTATKNQRPFSFQLQATSREPANARRNLSIDGTSVPGAHSLAKSIQSTLRRRGSESSESSFKRSRLHPIQAFGFRKTLRQTSPAGQSGGDMTKGGGRFSLRSLSPPSPLRRGPGHTAPPPVSMGSRMRQTMRSDSSDGSTHRMRIPSFGRSSGKKFLGKGSKATSSRFGDSSDEDNGIPSTFRSRFADSSDEDEAVLPRAPQQSISHIMARTLRLQSPGAASAPVVKKSETRTFSRQQEAEVESSDLPDSDDEVAMRQRTDGPIITRLPLSQSDITSLQRKRSGRGALFGSSTTTPSLGTQAMSGGHSVSQHRRGSLMSVLRRKKEVGGGKISRPELSESAARRDTKLERTMDELAAIRAASSSPKLQKQRITSWPFPDNIATQESSPVPEAFEETLGKRPATADAQQEALESPSSKPGFMSRRSMSQGLLGLGRGEARPPEVKRKKKFGTLRRMFGLND
jgi:serine/arginine repetitive matrix protein 2